MLGIVQPGVILPGVEVCQLTGGLLHAERDTRAYLTLESAFLLPTAWG